MLLDSHDIMKAIIRLGPRAPAVLPANSQSGAEETLRDGSLSPNRPSRTRGEGTTPQPRTRETDKLSATRGGQVQTVVATKKGSATASSSNSDAAGVEGESLRSGERRGPSDPKRGRGGLGGDGENRSAAHPPWGGYDVREGEIADASTRKLCSLPFDYFRLVANVARVPSGRAIVQSSGTLKRCLERMALNLSGCPAAQLATLRCRSEICILIGRMAGTYDRKTGAANEFILYHRYQTLRVLLGMLGTPPEGGRPFGATRMQMELARHNAAYALAEICRDTLRSVPLMADAGGIHLACRVANDLVSPIPLLKQVRVDLARSTAPIVYVRVSRLVKSTSRRVVTTFWSSLNQWICVYCVVVRDTTTTNSWGPCSPTRPRSFRSASAAAPRNQAQVYPLLPPFYRRYY